MVPTPPDDDESVGGPIPVSTPSYREPDLARVREALQRQVTGAHRVVAAFDKAKEVSQQSLDYEVSL